MSHITTLADMAVGSAGTVAGFNGGAGVLAKMEAMGILEGCIITKVSQQFMKGPVIVRLKGSQIAIGYGIAQKILIELS